jgi:hypothetical protein
MKQWGKGNIKYPTPILKLVMLLCMHEAPRSQIPEYLTHVITTFYPGLVGMPVPTAECCRIWRLALLPMTDLVAALKLSRTKRLSIHHDGSSKNTDKIAVAVLDTDDGLAMPNGVFTQRDGTAKHTAELVFRSAFEMPQVTLEKARAHFERCDEMRREEAPTRFSERLAAQGDASIKEEFVPLAGYIPVYKDFAKMVWDNTIPLALVSDHANAALATSNIITDMLTKMAEEEGVVFEGTYDVGDGDHKRLNTFLAFHKGGQEFLANVLKGKELDQDEYGEGDIMTMFYRQLCNACSERAGYVFGHGSRYRQWMRIHYPSHYISLPKEVGNHYDWKGEMALSAFYNFSRNLEFMLHVAATKPALNKMEGKLIRLLACMEVKMVTKAEGLLWTKIGAPLRCALDSTKDFELYVLDLNAIYVKIADLLKAWSTCDIGGFNQGQGGMFDIKNSNFAVDLFGECIPDRAKEKYFESLVRYRAGHERDILRLESFGVADNDDDDEMCLRCLQAMCKIGYTVWSSFAAPHLPSGEHAAKDGALARPDAETKKHLAKTKGNNKPAESSFGIYDRVLNRVTNASAITLTALTAAKVGGIFDFLKKFLDEKFEGKPSLREEAEACFYDFFRKEALPRARLETEKTAQQIADSQESYKKGEDETRAKESKKYLEHAMLDGLKGKLMAVSKVALMDKLQEIGSREMSPSEVSKCKFKFCRL